MPCSNEIKDYRIFQRDAFLVFCKRRASLATRSPEQLSRNQSTELREIPLSNACKVKLGAIKVFRG